MARTRVKICGITRVEDGLEAARHGADAIGLVFYAPSPRAVTPTQARAIALALPPFITVTALFVDAEPELIEQVLREVPVDLLQFHGREPAPACERYGRPYIKALAMEDGIDLHAQMDCYSGARGLLLDTYKPGVPGGTGERFDWAQVPHDLAKPVILAGGLSPANVRQAIAQVRPYAVDVSGGVEAAKGIKDAGKIAAFINEVASV